MTSLKGLNCYRRFLKVLCQMLCQTGERLDNRG